jgi:hypothetical protein
MIMKKYFFLIAIVSCLSITACDEKESPGDNYDFTNSLPPYVGLSSTAAKTVAQGGSTTVTFNMRTSIQQDVTVHYSLIGDNINLPDQTATILRDKTSVAVTIDIPDNVIVSPATDATAVLTLLSASKADGTAMGIGSKNVAATQKVTINITL